MKPEYVETRVSCPNCGNLNEPGTGLPCSMCSYIGATVESPLRRHLDERRIERDRDQADRTADVREIVPDWPITGCVSPAHD